MAVSWLLAIPIVVFLLINLKALPLVWHLRLFTFLIQSRTWLKPSQIHATDTATAPGKQQPTTPTPTPTIFQPLIFRTASPLLEIDYYLHKSNATFFADVDIARSHLVAALIWPLVRHPTAALLPNGNAVVPKGQMLAIMLGGVQCSFRREIRPYQKYEIWTRVLTWDEKWVFFISHFVRAGAVPARPEFTLQRRRERAAGKRIEQAEIGKAVLATAVSRNVLKLGRATVRPEDVWRAAGLWPGSQEGVEGVEMVRRRGLDVLKSDNPNAVHRFFEELVDREDGVVALGEYRDLWAWC
ncbi:hypothetical protein A1O1_05955 [Capronia coronata CBS 617.96]|uniref:Thioesterase n=1 Tax=Capronia coronata CBS 617.96 TaxID=1182541 RepID=W9Y7I0_9EURO|nr:uncharacterized protein A1O1_05955 [Capronia coronata CBS 617.96]EXJ85590.1 hypothetical protein A1O1_05955 [Capronia coronata CBS 617.96]